MEHISSTEVRNNFSEVLDKVQRRPISIRKQGRDVAVMMSAEDFKRFRGERGKSFLELRDKIAENAAARGLTEEILAEILAEKK